MMQQLGRAGTNLLIVPSGFRWVNPIAPWSKSPKLDNTCHESTNLKTETGKAGNRGSITYAETILIDDTGGKINLLLDR